MMRWFGCALAGLAMADLAMVRGSAFAQDLPTISVTQVHKLLREHKALLVDVRSPHEWKATGVPAGAVAISFHDPHFRRKIDKAAGAKTRMLLLICSIAGRSRDVQKKLLAAGYRDVRNVREGIMGNEHGFGWKDQDLPMARYDGELVRYGADR